jgi:hypothetical protein
MKVNRTLLAIGLFSALQTGGIGQPATSDLSASAINTDIQPSDPLVVYKLEPQSSGIMEERTIMRVGNESSRAWTTIASEQPNPTVFHDASTHEPRFYLCSFGHEPWR